MQPVSSTKFCFRKFSDVTYNILKQVLTFYTFYILDKQNHNQAVLLNLYNTYYAYNKKSDLSMTKELYKSNWVGCIVT